MPPLPPVPNVALCRVTMLQGPDPGGHFSQNVLHIGWTGGIATDADMDVMAGNLAFMYEGLFSGVDTSSNTYISEDTRLVSVTATDLTSPTAAFGSWTGSTPGAAAQVSPVNTAFLLRHQVLRRFRGGHSRTYIPGITPDNTTDGRTWTTAAFDDITGWWTGNMGSVVGGIGAGYTPYPNITGGYLAQVSYFEGGARRADPLVDRVVDTIGDQVIRSQRRRVRVSPTPS